jgi:hypothetical protein
MTDIPVEKTPTTFRERITTLGVKGFVTILLDVAWIVSVFTTTAYPDKLQWLTIGMNGWLIGESGIAAVMAKLGK